MAPGAQGEEHVERGERPRRNQHSEVKRRQRRDAQKGVRRVGVTADNEGEDVRSGGSARPSVCGAGGNMPSFCREVGRVWSLERPLETSHTRR